MIGGVTWRSTAGAYMVQHPQQFQRSRGTYLRDPPTSLNGTSSANGLKLSQTSLSVSKPIFDEEMARKFLMHLNAAVHDFRTARLRNRRTVFGRDQNVKSLRRSGGNEAAFKVAVNS